MVSFPSEYACFRAEMDLKISIRPLCVCVCVCVREKHEGRRLI